MAIKTRQRGESYTSQVAYMEISVYVAIIRDSLVLADAREAWLGEWRHERIWCKKLESRTQSTSIRLLWHRGIDDAFRCWGLASVWPGHRSSPDEARDLYGWHSPLEPSGLSRNNSFTKVGIILHNGHRFHFSWLECFQRDRRSSGTLRSTIVGRSGAVDLAGEKREGRLAPML